jgi:hypothetical protein
MGGHDEIVGELRARWPAVKLAPEAITELAREVGGDALAGAHRDDVLLAWGCLGESPEALARLDAAALIPAGVHARRTGMPAELVDDALQIARMRLVIGEPGRPPGLRGYRGRGPLTAFVRTAVLRIAIDLRRRDRELPGAKFDARIEDVLSAAQPDPELEYMRRTYKGSATRCAPRGSASLRTTGSSSVCSSTSGSISRRSRRSTRFIAPPPRAAPRPPAPR